MKNLNQLYFNLMLVFLFSLLTSDILAQKSELLKNYSWRAIGPANMGGRVTDIDGVPGDISTFYVSGADGGIHKTVDGGITFKPIFENQRAYSIGALTIAPSDKMFFGSELVKETQGIVLAMVGEFIDLLMEVIAGNILDSRKQKE